MAIVLGCGVLAATIAWSVFLALRGAPHGWRLDFRPRAAAGTALAAVALASLGAKYFLVSEHATSVPFFDAWDGEGLQVYLRLVGGDLRWSDLLAPHNEHRIAIQRLVGLCLLVVNGQWDARLQMVVNAAVHVLAGGVLLGVLWHQSGRRRLDVLAVLVLLLWALPLGWQNTLNGFQLSFYLLVLFFVLPLALLPEAVPGSVRWYLGAAVLLLAVFTLGSGLANAAAVGLALGLGWLASPADRRDLAPGIVACLAVVMLGLAIAPPPHMSGGVQPADVWQRFRQWMAWPTDAGLLSPFVTWAPMLALVVTGLRHPARSTPIDRTLAALGVWVVLHGAAVSYARATLGADLAPRYFDILSLGTVANGAAGVVLLSRLGSRPALRIAGTAAVAWSLWTLAGLAVLSQGALRDGIPALGNWYSNHATNLRRFVQTGNIAAIAGASAPAEIPHPDASLLAGFLTHEAFRPLLPPDLQPPLSLESLPASPSAFVRGGTDPATPRDNTRPSWGSYGRLGSAAVGRFESALVSCPGTWYLGIDVAGALGSRHGTTLSLVDAGGETLSRLTTHAAAGSRWHTLFVRCPRAGFAVVAEDSAADRWFAFRYPVVHGPLSVLAAELARAWKAIMVAAALLAWLAVRLARAPGRQSKSG